MPMPPDPATQLPQDGLNLRPLSERDLPEIVRQLSEPCIAEWLATVARPFALSDAEALLDHARHAQDRVWVITTDTDMAGCLSVGSNLWFWTAPRCQRLGVMKTALHRALCDWFAGPALPLTATCRADNHASRALLARLGFSEKPGLRRMYFQSIARSETCVDVLMAPEQWHLLNPPRMRLGALHLRPACQQDARTLSCMVPVSLLRDRQDGDISRFIEDHRFRGGQSGLFMLEDDMRRGVGMALFRRQTPPAIHFISEDEAARHSRAVETALQTLPQ